MNLSYFIARRIAGSSTTGHSGTIIKIAIVTISLSIATMIMATLVLYGFKNGISEKVFGFWGHIHITDSKINRSLELSPILNNNDLKTAVASIEGVYDERDKDNYTKGGVSRIHPYIMMPAIINRKDDLEGIILKGVDEEYDWTGFEQYLREGRFPDTSTKKPGRDILISEQTARRLQVDVDDKLVIYFLDEQEAVRKAFNISGIYKTGLEEYDVKFAFLHMGILQDVLEWDSAQVGGFEVFIDDIEDAELLADYIYNEILPPNLYAQTIKEKFDNLFEWIGLQDLNALLLLVLMTLVAVINMSTALLILILERARMIGVLKSIGANIWTIRKVFLYVAFWIMTASLILGNFLGLGLAAVQKYTGFMKLDETNYYLSEVPIEFNWYSILLLNLATMLVTVLFMLIPTYLVSRIQVIKILRFD